MKEDISLFTSIWRQFFTIYHESSITRLQFVVRLLILFASFAFMWFLGKYVFDNISIEYQGYFRIFFGVILWILWTYVFLILFIKRTEDIAPSEDSFLSVLKGLGMLALVNIPFDIIQKLFRIFQNKELEGKAIIIGFLLSFLVMMLLPSHAFKKSQK